MALNSYQPHMNLHQNKNYCFVLLIFTALWLPATILAAPETQADHPTNVAKELPAFITCTDKNLGFKIKCSPKWGQEIQKHSLIFILKDKPYNVATLSITRFPNSDTKLDDLTPSRLQKSFHYAQNFRFGPSKVADEKALVVVATLQQFPNVQILDYFVMKKKDLYRISFTVHTKNRYAEYKDLFGEIVRSFQFIPLSPTKLSSEASTHESTKID